MKIPKEAKIVFREQEIDDIESKVNTYANYIYSKGIDSKTPFGIYVDRSPECLFIMLAAIKIGAPFMPLDISLPYERICFMLQDSNITHLAISRKYEERFKEYQTICIDSIIDNLVPFILQGMENEVIYILYTSGSTGNPKGVEVRRDGFFSFIEGVSKIIDFSPKKIIACLTSVSFDIFFLESVMALYKGLTVILTSDDESSNPRLLSKIMIDNKVNMVQMTPSRIQLLINYDNDLKCLSNMSEILVGGEPLPARMLSDLQRKTKAKIYNMYGPTETTIWSTIGDLTNKNEVDIGVPIEGTKIYIVDEELKQVTDGIVGEICISGKGVAKGYINNENLTNEKFVLLPFPVNERIYRTGDFGKIQDGIYIYHGRKDNQIKIRGHRVELEEIENAIMKLDGINQATVLLDRRENNNVLLAFYSGTMFFDSFYLKKVLGGILPGYMIPSAFIKLDCFPYTTSGKVDRLQIMTSYNKMRELEILHDIQNDYQIVQNQSIDDQILDIIAELIDGYGEITPECDFLSLGLDSITFITIVISLEEKFEFEFEDDMLQFTSFSNINAMISYVKAKIGR